MGGSPNLFQWTTQNEVLFLRDLGSHARGLGFSRLQLLMNYRDVLKNGANVAYGKRQQRVYEEEFSLPLKGRGFATIKTNLDRGELLATVEEMITAERRKEAGVFSG